MGQMMSMLLRNSHRWLSSSPTGALMPYSIRITHSPDGQPIFGMKGDKCECRTNILGKRGFLITVILTHLGLPATWLGGHLLVLDQISWGLCVGLTSARHTNQHHNNIGRARALGKVYIVCVCDFMPVYAAFAVH
ncbi:hypothetical protein BJX76DRAFT_96452 [Aspergillus varians]